MIQHHAFRHILLANGQCVKNGLANFNMEIGPNRQDSLFGQHPKGIPEDKAPLGDKLGKTMFVDPHENSSASCIPIQSI
jgi:hypothetical protein